MDCFVYSRLSKNESFPSLEQNYLELSKLVHAQMNNVSCELKLEFCCMGPTSKFEKERINRRIPDCSKKDND